VWPNLLLCREQHRFESFSRHPGCEFTRYLPSVSSASATVALTGDSGNYRAVQLVTKRTIKCEIITLSSDDE
jgi:hypothetical protein